MHGRREPEQLTWYQPTPRRSLKLIQLSGVGPTQRIVDIGGGSSRLCDELVEAGFGDVTVVDISAEALGHVKTRLSDSTDAVTLIECDVDGFSADRSFDLWHDRAVFHFLTDHRDRSRYVDSMMANLTERGHVVMATFGLDGPETCSGLPVRRYSPESLTASLGGSLEPIQFEEEMHETPTGGTQHFLYGLFRRNG